MTHHLRDPLEDLVGAVPSYVVPDVHEAWAAGARRRWRRRVGAAAVAAAVLVLVATGAGVLPRADAPQPADGPGGGIRAYPERIEHSWWVHDLPAAPGPVAGLLERGRGWDAVSADGHLWHLPDMSVLWDTQPALSDDGRTLGYLTDQGDGTSAYVIRDLVTGERTTFDQVGDARDISTDPYLVFEQTPAYVAPDRSAVLVRGASFADPDHYADGLLLGVDGSLHELRVPTHPYLAGWLPDGSLVWVAWQSRGTDTRTDVYVTTAEGEPLRHVALQSIGHTRISQHSPRVSPDGSRLALVTGSAGDRVRVFSMVDGSLLSTSARRSDTTDSCEVTWAGNDVLVPAVGTVLTDLRGRPVVTADPRLELGCSIWATDAVAGDRHRGLGGWLFGTSDAWAAWHYRELALGSLAGLVLLGALLKRGRRRRPVEAPISWYDG